VVAVTTLTIAAEHPALVGHFPGMPIVPGVVLLDEMLRTLAHEDGAAGSVWRIGAAKFVKLVRPGELLTLSHERLDNGSIRFSIDRDGHPVAHGVIVPVHRNPQDDSAGS
jgi:3-hydroxymyristoyl/3-hydroxydecanoyl-(acyl carrier protein) dehydratase